MNTENGPINPNRLTVEQTAKLLSAAGKVAIPVEQLVADVAAGAPQNPDGTLNLVHYAAWLVAKEEVRGSV